MYRVMLLKQYFQQVQISETMSLHYSDGNGGCGLPGVEEITERKCEKLAERIAEKCTLLKGAK